MNGSWQHGVVRGSDASQRLTGWIVKLGGSLLTRPTWPDDIAALLADPACPSADAADPVIIVGGGPVVDGLRVIDAASPMLPALMHDLAIDAMRLTARIVAEALRLELVTTIGSGTGGGGVLDAAAWLTSQASAARIPQGWEVTSDSIAAIVAMASGRDLMLVKSSPPPCPGPDLVALATAGWVDDFFPIAAKTLGRIAWASPP